MTKRSLVFFFPLTLLINFCNHINICTCINPILANHRHASECQTSPTRRVLSACDSGDCSVKSRRFHFAEATLTSIILCEITKKDWDILLHCQSAGSPALIRVLSPLPPSILRQSKQKATVFEGVYHEMCGARWHLQTEQQKRPKSVPLWSKESRWISWIYMPIYQAWQFFSKTEDESKSVQSRWQLNEFL